MTDTVENLILEHLKKFQAEMMAARERDTEILTRLASMESMIASVKRDTADIYTELAGHNVRTDRINARIERIEKRLELA